MQILNTAELSRRGKFAFAILVVALALAACGGGGGTTASSSNTNAAAASGSAGGQPATDGASSTGSGRPGAEADLSDPCSLLTADEAAEVAGVAMPGEFEQTFDSTALYQAWASAAGVDIELAGSTSACTRASIEITSEQQSTPPPGTVSLTPTVATLTAGTFSEEIMRGNGAADASADLGRPGGIIVQTGEETVVTVLMIVDDTHLVSLLAGIQGAAEADVRALALAAGRRMAANLT